MRSWYQAHQSPDVSRKTNSVVKLSLVWMTLTALLGVPPLLGATLAGHPLANYLEFPPRTRYVQHAEFSWAVFACLSIAAVPCVLAIVRLCVPGQRSTGEPMNLRPMPRWGWAALTSLLFSWVLAWTRFEWLHTVQSFSFLPLWMSYVLAVNALTCRRTGVCLLIQHPRYFWSLFPVSALFWWYFEYLNRFVQNWYYSGIEEFTPLRYSIQATLAFSTVLPAVVSTMELMQSFFVFRQAARPVTAIAREGKFYTGLTMLLACLGLMAVAVWPDYLFPLIWFVPVLILECLLRLLNMESMWCRLRYGDWQLAALSMLAALVCGLFWEMWNFYSTPKWLYSIPFVNRFKIFEMPILGYLGYLPFGLECLVVATQLKRIEPKTEECPR